MVTLKIMGTVPTEQFTPFLQEFHGLLVEKKYNTKCIHVAGFNDRKSFTILLPPELFTDELSDLLGGVAMKHGAELNEKIEAI